jgi:integrase
MATNESKARRAKLPPGIYRRTTSKGPRFMALVRVAPFDPTSRTFNEPEQAIAWAAAKRADLEAQRAKGEAVRSDLPSLTLRGLIAEYIADPVTQGLRSLETTEERLGWWTARYADTRVMDCGVRVLRAAREQLQSGIGLHGLPAPATVNRYLSALRACWNWGRGAALVPNERAWPTKLMLSEPKGRTRFLTDEELTQLLVAAKKQSPAMHAMVIVSLATGMRQGELLRLTWADIDFERARAQIRLTKNDEARAVHLSATAVEVLKELRRSSLVSSRHIFLTSTGRPMTKELLRHAWVTLRDAVGLTDFTWHDLRHTCASFLAQKGATLLEIGSVLGHKSPSMTLRYSHLVQGAPVTGHAALDEKLRS